MRSLRFQTLLPEPSPTNQSAKTNSYPCCSVSRPSEALCADELERALRVDCGHWLSGSGFNPLSSTGLLNNSFDIISSGTGYRAKLGQIRGKSSSREEGEIRVVGTNVLSFLEISGAEGGT